MYLNIDFNTTDVNISKYVQLLLLLYTDDTIVVSESKQGLQKALDALHIDFLDWKLEFNENQTNVMVFNGRKNPRDVFTYGGKVLAVFIHLNTWGLS